MAAAGVPQCCLNGAVRGGPAVGKFVASLMRSPNRCGEEGEAESAVGGRTHDGEAGPRPHLWCPVTGRSNNPTDCC